VASIKANNTRLVFIVMRTNRIIRERGEGPVGKRRRATFARGPDRRQTGWGPARRDAAARCGPTSKDPAGTAGLPVWRPASQAARLSGDLSTKRQSGSKPPDCEHSRRAKSRRQGSTPVVVRTSFPLEAVAEFPGRGPSRSEQQRGPQGAPRIAAEPRSAKSELHRRAGPNPPPPKRHPPQTGRRYEKQCASTKKKPLTYTSARAGKPEDRDHGRAESTNA